MSAKKSKQWIKKAYILKLNSEYDKQAILLISEGKKQHYLGVKNEAALVRG